MKIVVAGGYWSSNIGNAFFNLGAIYQLKRACLQDRVVMLSDRAGYWDFLRHREPKNSFCFLEHAKYDYLVLQGSVLGPRLRTVWQDSLAKIVRKGTKLILLGVGISEHTQKDIQECRELLKQSPPFILVSRDDFTYQNFHDLSEYSYNGIDNGFFVSDVFRPFETDLPPYIALNFDKLVEPSILVRNNAAINDNSLIDSETQLCRKYSFVFDRQSWQIEFPLVRFVVARKLGKLYPYIIPSVPNIGHAKYKIGNYKIIRTNHQCNPMFLRRAFKQPETFISDVPYTYLQLYANCKYAFTDRVHTCVACLSFGNAAMLFTDSCRSRLLDRVNAGQIYHKLTRISPSYLESEKKSQINFLKKSLS
ncbi:MAG: polysaccharide pyruvyl transferase family protein [Planctomycetota bacterium]|jgi:hypothetical protein